MPPYPREHARQQDAQQAPGCIGRIIEADILRRLFRSRIGQDQIRVQRRNHCEGKPNTSSPTTTTRSGRGTPVCVEQQGQHDGDQRPDRRPTAGRPGPRGSAHRGCVSPAAAPAPALRHSRWSRPPGTRRPACTPAIAVEEHRQPDDEPYVARAEHENAGRGQQVDRARLSEQLGMLLDDFALPSVRGSDSSTPPARSRAAPAISHKAGRKPTTCNSKPPMKKPTPFMAFFEPVNHATQRNNCPAALRRCRLDRGLSRLSW